jgi:hypothetical protein
MNRQASAAQRAQRAQRACACARPQCVRTQSLRSRPRRTIIQAPRCPRTAELLYRCHIASPREGRGPPLGMCGRAKGHQADPTSARTTGGVRTLFSHARTTALFALAPGPCVRACEHTLTPPRYSSPSFPSQPTLHKPSLMAHRARVMRR